MTTHTENFFRSVRTRMSGHFTSDITGRHYVRGELQVDTSPFPHHDGTYPESPVPDGFYALLLNDDTIFIVPDAELTGVPDIKVGCFAASIRLGFDNKAQDVAEIYFNEVQMVLSIRPTAEFKELADEWYLAKHGVDADTYIEGLRVEHLADQEQKLEQMSRDVLRDLFTDRD